MNSKKACKRIKKIEKKYYKKFYINEINIWPLVRLHLWKYLTSNIIQNNKPNFLIILKNIVKKIILNIKICGFSNQNIFSKNIFFSKKEVLSTLKNENKNYDRIMDPIFKVSKKKN